MTVERWTKEKTEDEDTTWDESSRGKEKAGTRLGEGFQQRPGLRTRGRCRTRGPDGGGGAKRWAGADLEPGGGSRGDPEYLENSLRVCRRNLARARAATSVCKAGRQLCAAAGNPGRLPRSAGPGWSQCSSIHPWLGLGRAVPLTQKAERSLEVPRVTSQSHTDGGGAGAAFPRRQVHSAPALLPPIPSLPLLVSPFFPPSLPTPIQLLWCPTWNPIVCALRRGERLSPQDWEDSEQMSITCEF